jgi:hypothetical protein
MKINFTKSEFRALLDLIYLGDWVLTAHDVEPDTKKSRHQEIVQKIYSYAKDFGFDNLIKHDHGRDSYSETLEFEEGDVREFLNDFEENNFWESLISNLAERDFHKEIGPDGLRKLSIEENFEIIGKHEENWADEFSKHGLENLKK